METTEQREPSSAESCCWNCGKPIGKQAVVCVHCGVAARLGRARKPFNKGKSKTTAVLLAVFLGPWTWLYTIKRDWVKFLIGIVLFMGASLFIALGEMVIWILQGRLSDPQVVWVLGLVVSGLLLATIYLWAIIDTATKPASWYGDTKASRIAGVGVIHDK